MIELPLDAAVSLGHVPFTVRHALAGDPRLDLDRLVQLAARLPTEDVEWNVGDLPVGQDPALTPRNGLTPAETVRRIAECRSWLVLKRVERDPEYAAVLEACLEPVRRITDMHRLQGFVFVSSPGAVTPFHVDHEQNFLLQVRGTKTMHVWNPADRVALPEEALERFLTGGHRNLAWHEGLAARAAVYTLGPGDGVHVPVTAPHWVKNGPEPSVSFSVTFYNRATDAREAAVKVNALLRRFGVAPAPLGRSRTRDRAKSLGFSAARQVARLLR